MAALNNRLRTEADTRGIDVNRLRRQVAFERMLVRLAADRVDDRDRWVLKGGLALEFRLNNLCRATKDLDIAITDGLTDGDDVRDELFDALADDRDGDHFVFAVGQPQQLAADQGGRSGWRFPVDVRLAGKTFANVRLDVVARASEIAGAVEPLTFRSALAFAGYPASVTVPAIDVNQHAAEKLHALTGDYGARPNTRVKDLVDLVLLIEHDLIEPSLVAERLRSVFLARATHDIPVRLPDWPAAWRAEYGSLVASLGVEAATLDTATAIVVGFWTVCRV
ncbi:MAG TPA: nucleotidyl transferase AbiEii/AbiGii toxin family protein [Pseudonocardiaceae bacterium]|nr:nucleotidyl transferase AbiEii/AbiGii toxin family protein [Pseudonocardiaceae bacterium]